MRPYRVEYVQMAGWEDDVVGLWLAENEDWLLLRAIPVDYVVDGYMLLAKAHIVGRKPKRGRKQVEQVLKLKGVQAEVPAEFAFGDTLQLLRWVEQHYGVVEFTDEEKVTFFGWIKEADAVHFWADTLTSEGNVLLRNDDKPPFVRADIQSITFDTDYFNSIKLLWQHKSRLKLLKPNSN